MPVEIVKMITCPTCGGNLFMILDYGNKMDLQCAKCLEVFTGNTNPV